MTGALVGSVVAQSGLGFWSLVTAIAQALKAVRYRLWIFPDQVLTKTSDLRVIPVRLMRGSKVCALSMSKYKGRPLLVRALNYVKGVGQMVAEDHG